jgi:hypothetical protein
MLWLMPIGLIALAAAWFWLMISWSYSAGERAGWVQKFSRKGWICKTWEGEVALVTMPGTAQEKFLFTVWNDDVAAKINAAMGKRVSLHYEEKVGLRHLLRRYALLGRRREGGGRHSARTGRGRAHATGGRPASPVSAAGARTHRQVI